METDFVENIWKNSFTAISGLSLISDRTLYKLVGKDIRLSVIIFDWDDTLLCTHHLLPSGVYEESGMLTKNTVRALKAIDKAESVVLKRAMDLGRVYIVTNSVPGWV